MEKFIPLERDLVTLLEWEIVECIEQKISRRKSEHCDSVLPRISIPSSICFSPIILASLYLVALGSAGIKSALPLHGADQFDENDKKEAIQMSSFFQLAFVGCVSWWCNWGFFVSTLAMLFGAIIFCVGLPWYRIFVIKGTSAITEIFQVYVAAIRNRNLQLPEDSSDLYEIDEDEEAAIPAEFLPHTDTFNPTSDIFDSTRFHHGHKITNSFHIPPASLPIIPIAFLIIIIPVYDQIIIPILRKFTGIPTGITYLQRVRVGLVLSAISMAIASIIEVKCKHVAREHNMLDAVPMLQPLPISVFWLSIQVFIFGIADMFTYVGNY